MKTLVIVELTLKITYQHALYVLYLKIRRWNIVPCDDIFLNQAIFGKGHIMKSKAAFIASYSKQGNCIQWFILGIGRFSNNGNHLAITPVFLLKNHIDNQRCLLWIWLKLWWKKVFFKLWVSIHKKTWHTPELLKSMINYEPIDQYQVLRCVRWLVSQEKLRFLLRHEHNMLNYSACSVTHYTPTPLPKQIINISFN